MSYTPKPAGAYQFIADRMVEGRKASGLTLKQIGAENFRKMAEHLPDNLSMPDTSMRVSEIPVDGHTVKMVHLRPLSTEDKVLPCLIYLHGGGFVFFQFRNFEKLLKELVVRTKMAVVYIEYSLSPEAKFPTAFNEAYDAVHWVHKHASELHIDADKLALAGDSAGGNLTSTVSLKLVEDGHGDLIKGQVMVYPDLNFAHDMPFASWHEFASGDYGLPMKEMAQFTEWYFEDASQPCRDIRASPIRATDDQLKGAPPALIVVAELDLLRDEGLHYAQRLNNVGVPATAVTVAGTMHGFMNFYMDTPQYCTTRGLIVSFLRDLFDL
ncbi:Alpha/Beta hydrolase protein [Gongronella butleri]|nr:Alpha/Beta hydrolase protein [Gongronella butleri]